VSFVVAFAKGRGSFRHFELWRFGSNDFGGGDDFLRSSHSHLAKPNPHQPLKVNLQFRKIGG